MLVVVALAMDLLRKDKLEPDLFKTLRLMMVGILLTDLFWNGCFWLTLLVSTADGHASIMLALHERLYMGGELLCGMLLSLVLLLLPQTREDRSFLCLASVLIIGGVFLMGYSVVFIGFDIPLT